MDSVARVQPPTYPGSPTCAGVLVLPGHLRVAV